MTTRKQVAAKVRDALEEGGPKVQCLECNSVIQSKHRHDFVRCSCQAVAVDGGTDYFKMCTRQGARWKRV